MNDNVVTLDDHRKPTDPEMIESLRVMLSEAQNGRLVGFAASYITHEDTVQTVFHFSRTIDAAGAVMVLHQEVAALFTE